jgi:hypothetical protein
MAEAPITESQVRDVLREYLTLLQRHPTAEEMMSEILTEDFETGFEGGFRWQGIDGLRDFLQQREGFFDEHHEVKEILDLTAPPDGDVQVKTRLEFFLRRWEAPSPTSEAFTGSAYHTWRLRQTDGSWRVAAQIVDGFDDLNDNAQGLFATPEAGLNR